MRNFTIIFVVILFMVCTSASIQGQETKKQQQQGQQSKPQQSVEVDTGKQGNLTELAGVLGDAKSRVVDLEKNGKNTVMLRFTIEQATEAIQKAKDLLDEYDYLNKPQIRQQVNDLEQRLFAVVMSL